MLRIFLTNREGIDALSAVSAGFFGERVLPSTLLFVSSLVAPDWRVELEITRPRYSGDCSLAGLPMNSGGQLLTLMLVVASRRRYDDDNSDGRALRCSL